MPDQKTVWLWKQQNSEFSDAILRCREEMVQRLLDEMIAIADNDRIPVQQARVMVEARRIMIKQLVPYILKTSAGRSVPQPQNLADKLRSAQRNVGQVGASTDT